MSAYAEAVRRERRAVVLRLAGPLATWDVPHELAATLWWLGATGTASSVTGAGRYVGVRRRQCARILAGAGLPTPHELLRWGQLFRAQWLYRVQALPQTRVAVEVGMSDQSTLSQSTRRYSGSRPTEIPDPDALLERCLARWEAAQAARKAGHK